MTSRSLSGSPSFQNCFAIASLMMTTGGARLSSRSVNARPRLIGNLEHLEVARRDRQPAAAAVERPLCSSGRPDDREAAGRSRLRAARSRWRWPPRRRAPRAAARRRRAPSARRPPTSGSAARSATSASSARCSASKPGSTRRSASDVRISSADPTSRIERQRDFGDDEHRSRLVLAEAGARAAARSP